MNRTFHYVGTALLFLVASACQETSQDAEQISTTKTPVVSPTAATDTNNLLQANSTATALSLGKLAIPTAQTSSSTISLTNIAAQESRNAVADVTDSDTILSQTTQDLWKIAPEMETFVLKAEEENTVELKQGSVIEFPKDAFVYAGTNEPVKGNVAIMAKEYRNMSDCITAGLTTMSDKGILESGGMMYVDAVAEGRKCELRKDKPMKVALPAWGKKDERMTLFTGKRKKNGQVTWKEMPKSEGEQLPENEAPKRKESTELANAEDADIFPSPPFTIRTNMPDSTFQGFVMNKMLPIYQYRSCEQGEDFDIYQERNRANFNLNLTNRHYNLAFYKGIYYFPATSRQSETVVKQRPIVKITQENHLTALDKTPAPKDFVSLTNKTLKALKLAYEEKWEEKKDANNQKYYVTKEKPLKQELTLKEEKTFCRVYVKTNQKGAVTNLAFKEYNFIMTDYMHKWLDYLLRQRVWKPNVEGNVFLDIYVGKKDFRKMKKWYAVKANTLAECKTLYETQYQTYLKQCREQYAANLPSDEKQEKAMAEYKEKVEKYRKRMEEKAAKRFKKFEQNYKESNEKVTNTEVGNYVFRTNQLGWVNCDYFYGQPSMVMNLHVKDAKKLHSTVIFTQRKVVLNQVHQNSYAKITLPKGENVLLWVIKEHNGKRYFALKEMVTGKIDVTITEFEELTFEKLQALTERFSKISET